MYAKDLYGNVLGSREYRAELTSRITKKPASRHDMPPQYAKIKEDARSHNCIECDKLYYEIERLQMKLDERSSRGSRLAMLDSKESSRSGDYKHNTDWEASWAATPDLLSTHSQGDNPRQKRQYKELEADVKRLKRELHQKSLEVRMLREARVKTADGTTLPTDLDAMVDPLPSNHVADLYDGIYKTDWQIANKALLNDKVNQEQAASKLIKVLVAAFAYCDKVAPEHLEAILASTITVKSQGNRNTPNMPKIDIHKETGLFRKCIAEKVALNIIKNFRFEVFMKMKEFTYQQKQNFDITKYVDKCVNITWFMAVQNYPIILDDSVERNKKFDFEHYGLFQDEEGGEETVYGYLVWPALINAENNTFICKGVAESLNTK